MNKLSLPRLAHPRLALLAGGIASLLALWALPAGPSYSAAVPVAIAPPTGTVPVGGAQPFTALVSGTDDQRVTWRLVDPSPARSPANDGIFEEPFAWLGHHAATIEDGAATTTWWDPDAWDVHAETSHNATSSLGGGHHIDIHQGVDDPASGLTPNTLYALGGNGRQGVGVMHTDYQSITSARLRNPLLISAARPGVVDFWASPFVTTGHWWEVALTPASQVVGGEFTAIPAPGSPTAGNTGPGNTPAQDSVNVILMGANDVPCTSGWKSRLSVAKAMGGIKQDTLGPAFPTDPIEKDRLVRYRVEYYPDQVRVQGDLNGDGIMEDLQTFSVGIPWSEAHVHFLGIAYQASNHPQGACWQGQVRELSWKDIVVGPIKYARTAAHPREDGTDRLPQRTGWTGYDIRDTQRYGAPVNGVSQPNATAYNKNSSLAFCSAAVYGCSKPVSFKTLSFDLPAEDAVGIASARLVYDIRRDGAATLEVNGTDAGPMPKATTVPADVEQWIRRSIDVDPALLRAGTNAIKIGMSGNVQMDRLQFELSYASAATGTKGTLSDAGLYAAPAGVPSPAMVAVRADSVANSESYAAAVVTIVPASAVMSTPTPAPIPTASPAPPAAATATPIPIPTITPTLSPTSTPTPVPVATATATPALSATPVVVPGGIPMSVDANRTNNPFDARMRGAQLSTWMHAALRKPGPNESANLPEVVKALRPGIVRFAGGLWANSTGWDRQNRIQEWSPQTPWKWTDPATGVEHPYAYRHVYNARMVDSLAAFAQATGAEVMVQINACDNNPAMWADLVRYANVEHTYGFEYWELSNELTLDENWRCLGVATEAEAIQEYGRRFLAYKRVLTAVDPSIKLMGPVTHQPWQMDTWLPPLLLAAANDGTSVDGVSWHRYPMWHSMTMANVEARLFDINTRRAMVETVMQNVYGMVNGNGSAGAEMAITELNTHVSDFQPTNSNHIGALWMLDILPRYAYNGLDINIWYNLYDGDYFELIYPDNSTTPTRLSVRPTYYGMLMLAQYFGDTLVYSQTGDVSERVVVWGSKDTQDPGKLKLLLVNMTGADATASIDIAGFAPRSGVYYALTNPNPTDLSAASTTGGTTINGASVDPMPGRVQASIAAIPARALSGISGQTVTHTLPAYSAAILILDGSDHAITPPTPTPVATATPAPSPTPVPSPGPTSTPTPVPTATPTPTPTPTPAPSVLGLPILPGDVWRYLEGRAAPPSGWNNTGFDDSAWPMGPSGFGYGDGDDTTLLADMQGNFTSIYIRRAFSVPDPNQLAQLTLSVDFDDGLVAYLNGVEVTRANMAGSPLPYNATASVPHDSSLGLRPVETYDLTPFLGLLVSGTNVLAIQGHNVTISSSDFSLIPSLTAVSAPVIPPTPTPTSTPLPSPTPTPTPLPSPTPTPTPVPSPTPTPTPTPSPTPTPTPVPSPTPTFTPVPSATPTPAPGSRDFSIVAGDIWRYFKGRTAPPTGWNSRTFSDSTWMVGPSGFGYGDGDDATLLTDMQGNYVSVYIRRGFTVLDPARVTRLSLTIDYDDGFVAYLNGTEVARSNVNGSPPAYNRLATRDHEASAGSGTATSIRTVDLSGFRHLLVAGTNVIALQGHNVSWTSSDFTLVPSLQGTE